MILKENSMISEKLSLDEVVDNISTCGYYDMIYKINMEATEAERIALKAKNSTAGNTEIRYARNLKALINFLRYGIILEKIDDKDRALFFTLKGRLENRADRFLEKLKMNPQVPGRRFFNKRAIRAYLSKHQNLMSIGSNPSPSKQ
jgi:hypothetical protein